MYVSKEFLLANLVSDLGNLDCCLVSMHAETTKSEKRFIECFGWFGLFIKLRSGSYSLVNGMNLIRNQIRIQIRIISGRLFGLQSMIVLSIINRTVEQ